MQLLLADR